MQQVKGHKDLYRDSKSGAIINKNSNAATAARAAMVKYKENQSRLTKLEDEISDIKYMLKQLLEK
jgi:hypothetical protein